MIDEVTDEVMDKVSVIIPTYNRFKYLMNALRTVKEQTYKNMEIIVINDGSTQEEYYTYDWKGQGIIIIHLEENTKVRFGHGCVGYVRNKGLELVTGKYVAFLDDDDIWFPTKTEVQMKEMKEANCKMSSTNGLIGTGEYNEKKKYANQQQSVLGVIHKKLKSKGIDLLDNGYPKIWTYELIKAHNCMINSSVILEKEILDKINGVPLQRRGQDWACWKNALKYTDSLFVDHPFFYYDKRHGDGSNH